MVNVNKTIKPYKKQAKKIYRKRARVYGKAGKQLYRDVMYLKGLINSELHFVNTTIAATDITSTGNCISLSTVPQGDSNSERSGNTILPRWLVCSGSITAPNSALAFAVVRLIVFRWKESSVPVPADVLQSLNVFSQLNDDNTGNKNDRSIEILYNETCYVVNGTSENVKLFNFNIDLNPSTKNTKDHIIYDGATTVPYDNSIYMMYLSDDGATPFPKLDCIVKLNFYDN